QSRFGSLDGLRCASIVGVVLHHTWMNAPEWLTLAHRGFLGVDMFFAISGYLIVTLLLREERKNGQISLSRFYTRRMLRIFPIYYFILGALTLLMLIKPGANEAPKFWASLPYLVTYTSNWVADASILAIAWSLATEEQFYIFWPPVERFLRGWAVPVMLAFVVVNQAVNFGLTDKLVFEKWGWHDTPVWQITFTPICLGVLLAHLLNSPRGFGWAWQAVGHRAVAPVLLAALLAVCALPAGDISGVHRLGIHLLITGLLAACVVREDHLLAGMLQWRIVVRIGVVSYGMYLYHMFARHGAEVLLGRAGIESQLALFPVTLALTYLVSELSYRTLEAFFLNLKSRFSA
ncbi:MAG: acyltransferase, partial [Phycisphaeraceae bacterium]|nr:acyltransferase [Phycisphaeraceae bacterium]